MFRCSCSCCYAYLSSCHRTALDANLLDDPHTFHYQDYFVIGGIRTCLEVSDDPMFLWISSNSCPLNLLLVWSHQAEIIIVKCLIQGRNNVTRVRVEPRSFDQGRRKNDAFTRSVTSFVGFVVFVALSTCLKPVFFFCGLRSATAFHSLISNNTWLLLDEVSSVICKSTTFNSQLFWVFLSYICFKVYHINAM